MNGSFLEDLLFVDDWLFVIDITIITSIIRILCEVNIFIYNYLMNSIYFNHGLINMQQIEVKVFLGIFCDLLCIIS